LWKIEEWISRKDPLDVKIEFKAVSQKWNPQIVRDVKVQYKIESNTKCSKLFPE
jgi:hypothetical protein